MKEKNVEKIKLGQKEKKVRWISWGIQNYYKKILFINLLRH